MTFKVQKTYRKTLAETFATEFIRRGSKVKVLQKLMGHTKITTTMKYVHVVNDMKRDAIQQLNKPDKE